MSVRNILAGAAATAALALAACGTQDGAEMASDAAAANEAQTASNAVAMNEAHATGPHPGKAVYEAKCATCHDNPEATKAPSVDDLGRLTSGHIVNAMITGIMIPQAAGMTTEEIDNVANYLSHTEVSDDAWMEAMACPADRKVPNLSAKATVATFGFDQQNTREMSYADAGLTAEELGDMELAWAIAFPQAITMRSQAAVVGNSLFVPVGESKNRLFAFDVSNTAEPCLQWVYEGTRTLRSSAGYGVREDGREVVLVGDMGAFVHMIDAETGEKIWESSIGLSDASVATGTPVLVGDKVYAPSSQFEIMMAAQPTYECCKIHGGVVALDAMTGERVWEGHTMEDAKPIRDRGDGQMLWGPAGAPVWNSPAIDLERGQLYVGTGEANSENAHPNTDALLAFDLETGEINWSYQATANDVYNVGCGPNPRPEMLNCAKDTVYRDVDFGASTILKTAPNGQDLVLAGQKSGTVWAMNPDNGEVVWRTDLGTGGAMGGVHWGIAADDTHVYAPISNAGSPIPDQDVPEFIKRGIYALNLDDGSIDWSFYVESACDEEAQKLVPRCKSNYGLSGAPTIIGDHIITGSLDGRIFVLEKDTGELVWEYQTARNFETINGMPGNGGAVDNASIVAANGLLFVNSGYGLFGQGAGNVMLAFKPKAG